jgi:hypothetical protein
MGNYKDDRAASREHRAGAAFYARTDHNKTDREHYGRPAPFAASTSTFAEAYPATSASHDAAPVPPARHQSRAKVIDQLLSTEKAHSAVAESRERRQRDKLFRMSHRSRSPGADSAASGHWGRDDDREFDRDRDGRTGGGGSSAYGSAHGGPSSYGGSEAGQSRRRHEYTA